MFETYFGFKANPFTIAPNPSYLYLSDQHREALAHLQYGLHESGGFIVLTGEVGTGKTTIWRCLCEQISDQVDLAVLLNPCLNSNELLEAICDEFHISYQPNAGIKRLTDALNRHLLAQHQAGKRCVLIVEEAQNLDDTLLEQLRLLTNLETNESKLLQIVLIGQPELADKLEQPQLRQLKQRIIARYHLGPLNKNEVKTYVEYRLSTAGGASSLFSRDALALLAARSGGIPRVINLICERALLGCYAQGIHQVNAGILKRAADEVLPRRNRKTLKMELARANAMRPILRPLGWAVSIAVLLVGAAFLLPNIQSTTSVVLTEMGIHPNFPSALSGAKVAETPPPPPLFAQMTSGDEVKKAAPAAKLVGNDASSSLGLYDKTLNGLAQLEKDSVGGDPYRVLFALWGVEFTVEAKQTPCQYGLDYRLDCWHRRGSLESIKRINRPAVLKMVSVLGKPFYATLTKIEEDGMLQMSAGSNEVMLSEADLVAAWTGEYTVLWRRPAGYRNTLYPGDKNKAVPWVARSLANLMGRRSLASGSTVYTAELENSVRRFQNNCGLFVDGLVGKETLIKLNSLVDDIPILYAKGKSCRDYLG